MPPFRKWDMKLELKDQTIEPFAEQPYRVPQHVLPEMWGQLRELQEIGFIQRSTSAYAAPARFVPKKDSTSPPCNDYRILNKNLVEKSMPIPRPDDILHALKGKTIFSKIDLQKGFHQIRLCPVPIT